MKSIISTRNMGKSFGDFHAVAGIDLDVYEGEIFGFLGPNGSGKTTSIRMMLGLLIPSFGDISVLGVPVIQHPEKIRANVGYMAQRFSLYNDLTAQENLLFYGRAYGINGSKLRKRVREAMGMAGIEHYRKTKAGNLSGGWRQRLALSAAILHEPQLIFLDEPTAGVDPVSRRAFWDFLYELVDQGTTVFFTTHYMEEAEHCHRLAFIQDGKIIATGSPEDIKKTSGGSTIVELELSDFSKGLTVLRNHTHLGEIVIQEISLHGRNIHIACHNPEVEYPKIRALLNKEGILILRGRVIQPTLEDIFISHMKSQTHDETGQTDPEIKGNGSGNIVMPTEGKHA